MKPLLSIQPGIAITLLILLIAGCSSPEGIVFANREWHISDYHGQIIDKDTTYRMTFGNVLIYDPLVIVSCSDSVARYPGMDRFIADVLHTCHLDSAEILFYAPEMETMFVRPKRPLPPMKPSSVSCDLSEERPYTLWVHGDDIEDWIRKPTEMYTYSYFNKRKKQLLIVDHYDYGDIPIAQITVFQTKNRMTARMNVKETWRHGYFEVHSLKKYMRDVEYWSNNVEFRRANAFANYKIGQEQKFGKKWNVH
ncbi:MAG: hypothetical protein K2G67_08480 [Muribaculaceae bacterium]|nr:hypothetical protein [Muribaculaceae bacterium]